MTGLVLCCVSVASLRFVFAETGTYFVAGGHRAVSFDCLLDLTMSVNLSTVQKGAKEVDSFGEWLRFGVHFAANTRIVIALSGTIVWSLLMVFAAQR